MGIIYILENKIDGKCYVGQTAQPFNRRFRFHNRSHSIVGNALRKYGVGAFNKILLENIPEEQLDSLERENIIKYNSIKPNGYNLDSGGNKNKHHHEETKRKISESHKGKHPTEETIRKIAEANRGKHRTKETKKKMSEIAKGKKKPPFTEKHKKNLSEAHKGKTTWMKGKHHTEEAKRKDGEAHKGNTNMLGKHHTKETREKISEMLKNRKLTEEHKENISKSKSGEKHPFFGKHHTEEAKEKNRLSHLNLKK